jgi:signal transduction histidine kinase
MSEHVRLEPWERQETTFLRFVPYGLLVIPTVITLLQPVPSTEYQLITMGVVATAAAWMFGLDTRNSTWRQDPQGRHQLPAIYFVGLLVLSTILILRAPWYGMFAFTGYLRAFICLSGVWPLVGVGVNALLLALSQVGGMEGLRTAGLPSFLVLCALNIALAGTFSYFGWRTIERDRERKETLTELAAALEENKGLHAQLLAQAREAGVLDERQRMAREIHDTLAQGLAGIITQLEAAAQNPTEWQRYANTAEALARESLSEARRSVHAIRPEALENARLPEAIADVVRRWSEINGVPAEVITTGTPHTLHPDVEVTLLRTAQEALANVAKHAGASRVGLTLSYMEDQISLDVRDDGAGFAELNGSGYGLTAMRQRVEALAGQLEIESEPGAGTAISAAIPTGALT